MKKENFMSNINKLIANIERIMTFKKYDILAPITLDIGPTNQCNLNCPFCSVKNRDRSLFLSLEQAIKTTDDMIDYGIKSIELTGGGEPTLWKHFKEYMNYIKPLKIPIGLITNGLLLKNFSMDLLETFTWIRVSLNGLDVGWFPDFEIPENVTLSFNYVWHSKTKPFEIKKSFKKILEKYPQTQVIKVQEDVFSPSNHKKNIFNDERIFVSQKQENGIPKKCYMGWIKPHLSAGGKIFRCSSVSLKNRKFEGDEYIISSFDDYCLDCDYKTFDTSNCERCFFEAQNDFISLIKEKMEHSDFI